MTGVKLHWYLPTHGDTATIADNQGGAQVRARSHLEPSLENLANGRDNSVLSLMRYTGSAIPIASS